MYYAVLIEFAAWLDLSKVIKKISNVKYFFLNLQSKETSDCCKDVHWHTEVSYCSPVACCSSVCSHIPSRCMVSDSFINCSCCLYIRNTQNMLLVCIWHGYLACKNKRHEIAVSSNSFRARLLQVLCFSSH